MVGTDVLGRFNWLLLDVRSLVNIKGLESTFFSISASDEAAAS